MTRRDACWAVLVTLIWGFNFVVIDWGMRGVPPLLFAAVRFVVVALPAVCFLVRPPAVAWWKIAVIGVFVNLGQFALLYSSIELGMPVGLASLVLQVQVAMTVVLAAVALRERPTRVQLVGVALGAIGLVVVGAGRGGHVPLGALLLCLGAALSWAIGNVATRAVRVPGGLSVTVWSALVVPVPMLLLALLVDGPAGVAAGLAHFGWRPALSTAYTAVLSSLVGYGLWNSLLSRYPPSTVVPWVLLVPPVGIVSAWLCLGERPNLAELGGGVVLVLGVLIGQRVFRRRPAPASRTVPAPEAVAAVPPGTA